MVAVYPNAVQSRPNMDRRLAVAAEDFRWQKNRVAVSNGLNVDNTEMATVRANRCDRNGPPTVR